MFRTARDIRFDSLRFKFSVENRNHFGDVFFAIALPFGNVAPQLVINLRVQVLEREIFKLLDRVMKLRVSPETEIGGLDIPEMGSTGYTPDDLPDLPAGSPVPVGAAAFGAA